MPPALPLALALALLAPGGPSASAAAKTYHVSTSGHDSAAGSARAPWRTVQHAADTVPAGAVVVIHPGRYTGFVVNHPGLPGKPTIYRGAAGAPRPVIDGSLLPSGVKDVIRINGQHNTPTNGAHDVRIKHLDVQRAPGGRYQGAGIRTENGASDIDIVGNAIHDNRSFGINISSSTGVLVRNNIISHNEVGVQVASGGEGTSILGNRIHHNDRMTVDTAAAGDDAGAVGIAFNKSSGHVLASGNRIWGNRAPSHDYGWDGSAFEIYGASNVTISGNTAWDNENVLETGTDQGGPACRSNRFVRNVVYGQTSRGHSWGMFLRCATDMLIAHDTFVGLERFVFSIGADSARYNGGLDGLRIVDCIVDVGGTGAKIYGFTTALPASVSIDHDLLRTSGQLATLADGRVMDSLAELRNETGFEKHGLAGAARFMDAAHHDYHLKADSPAVDVGVEVPGVSDTWAGAAPDLGRHERTP